MKRNAVAWAALVVSTFALVGSRNFSKPAPAAQEIPAEGQKTAKALSEAFEAVAEFAKPSVVQIRVEKKGSGILDLFGGRGPGRGPEGREITPEQMRELLKRMHPDLDEDQIDEYLKRNAPGGQRKGQRPRVEPNQFGFNAVGTGSGFIFDDKGHIVTNNHVVEGAEKVEVLFYDGDTATAKVVGTDPAADIAVIKVENTSYRPLPRGRSKNLKVGEWVMPVGSPFGLTQSVSAGIVSATERSVAETTGMHINDYESFIQTDAEINPGNSGGPLVDMSGRVVGVNAAIATTNRSWAGVGFAIPIDMATTLADKLIKDGKVSRVRVGIQMEPLTPKVAREHKLDPKTKGVLVAAVLPGSPADKAGIKKDDVITGFDGQSIYNPSGFKIVVSTSDPGKSYKLNYLRGGKEGSAAITPSPEAQVVFAQERNLEQLRERMREREREQEKARPRSRPAPSARPAGFGLKVEALTPEVAAKHGYPKETEGVVITDVAKDSPAFQAGLEQGDVITKFVEGEDVKPVKSARDFEALLGKNKGELNVFVKDVRHPTQPANLVKLSTRSADDDEN